MPGFACCLQYEILAVLGEYWCRERLSNVIGAADQEPVVMRLRLVASKHGLSARVGTIASLECCCADMTVLHVCLHRRQGGSGLLGEVMGVEQLDAES